MDDLLLKLKDDISKGAHRDGRCVVQFRDGFSTCWIVNGQSMDELDTIIGDDGSVLL